MEEKPGPQGGLALLIGIDTYPRFEDRRQLGGCVNDVSILKDALVRRFGFQEERITVLTDHDATQTAILAAFEDLVSRAQSNENVVVHFSGHGSLKPDGPENDEPDGWDETLVPCDSGRAPYPNRDITDDQIHDWLERLTARTPYVNLIIDCCHSGTIRRPETKVRGLPADDRRPEDLASPVSVKPARPVFRDAMVGSKTFLKKGEECVLFAACSSSESANEILVGNPPIVPHGALTYYLVQELMSPEFKGSTYTEVFERLRPRLTARCGDQHPQLEGERNREVFGRETILPMPFVSVLSREGHRVTLEAGASSGVAAGTVWIVYAPGTREVNEGAVRLGVVSVVSAGATTSEAKVLEEREQDAVIAGARAVEGFARLKVELEVPPEHDRTEALTAAIGSSSLLARVYAGNQADVQIRLLSPASEASELRRFSPLGRVREDVWVVADEQGVLRLPPVPARSSEDLKYLMVNLESMARLHALASVTNPGSALTEQVDFEIFLQNGTGPVLPSRDAQGEMLFHEGDRLVLEMRNRSPRPLYVYVLDIGLTGRVAIVYPPDEGSQEALERGQSFQAGIRSGEELTLALPPGFERLPEAFQRTARETLKLIVSTSPAEVRLLLQSGKVFRGLGPSGPLDEALVAAFGSGPPLDASSGEDWATFERTFRLLPKASPLA